MSKAHEVAQWLVGLGYAAQAVKIMIGGETWEGAVYTKEGQEPRYYLLGDLPKTYGKVGSCYRLEEADVDWYVICYMQTPEKLTESQKQYSPFGKSFTIGAWYAPGKIDDFERRPYKRISGRVEVVE